MLVSCLGLRETVGLLTGCGSPEKDCLFWFVEWTQQRLCCLVLANCNLLLGLRLMRGGGLVRMFIRAGIFLAVVVLGVFAGGEIGAGNGDGGGVSFVDLSMVGSG